VIVKIEKVSVPGHVVSLGRRTAIGPASPPMRAALLRRLCRLWAAGTRLPAPPRAIAQAPWPR